MGAKIIVIEDNETNMLLLKSVLTYYGYEVIEAVDGYEGVRMAKEIVPDLILMDIQMPVLDGMDALKMLKDDIITKNIKIIAVTSNAMKGDKENLLSLGFDGYVPKPIDTRQLPSIIEEFISKK
ncbi:MAG: response regulator [Nitrospirae bacterium]|nr:response regulator [Nitrospirota bacterium]MBF0520600.1 response regulator [Nitrospirota bacterium]MBF0534627.1 response regulator [Nitrospirota bacterium]MBF0616329.1 response regulator [Nitrospirota bacterium]